MDDHHNPHQNHHHHHHELPPFPSTAVTAPTTNLHSPPQNPCYLPPTLSQTCLASFSSSAPQSFFSSSHEPQPLAPRFPHSPTLLSYGLDEPNIQSVFPKDDGKKALDAWSTKVARTNRRLARQRTLTSFTTRSSSSSSCGYHDDYSKGLTITHFPNTDSSHNNRHLFTFCTPDNKILRMLLKKELKNSDVGSLGRIVLPKREAEENLPFLTDKEGLQIVVRDVNSNRRWTMKYKYWANNRSRMYVLENTGFTSTN
uniref:TF-B3 domain-containing protein n=1 Tax=Cucumis sativus TaxID=3659 RepID=A0A0A0KND0_CUCSA